MVTKVGGFRAYVGKHMMTECRKLQNGVVRMAGHCDFIECVTSNLALTPLQPEVHQVSLHELTKPANTVGT